MIEAPSISDLSRSAIGSAVIAITGERASQARPPAERPVERRGPVAADASGPAAAERGQPSRPGALLDPETQTAAQTAGSEDAPPFARPLLSSKEEKGPDGLTEEEREKVEELKRRDREVRAHEQAHKTAGGPYAGQPTFKTQRGPDGRAYAVSGEVRIDTSEVPNNPDATIRKMETVKRAALAPSQPSAKDRQVAAEAEAKAQKARLEKREEQAEERADATPAGGEQAGGTEAHRRASLAGTNTAKNRIGPAQGPDSAGGPIDPGRLLNLVA